MQKKDIKNIIIIFIITLVLELTVFNINSYRVLTSKNSRFFDKDDLNYIVDENETLVEISNVNEEVKTVHIEVKDVDFIEYNFLYTDETTSFLAETPTKTYIQDLNNSKYIATYLSRKK